MKFRNLIIVLSILVIVGCAPKLTNLTVAKGLVEKYYESGQYDKDMDKITIEALEELKSIPLNENSTVIFDVDETALSNYDYIKSIDYGFEWSIWIDYIKKSSAKAIPQVKKVYKWCVDNNVNVVFLTGRHHDVYEQTYRNLLLEGYVEIDTLICRNKNEIDLKAAVYKENARESLTEIDHDIIACFGDLKSDLAGKFTGIKVKLPNYLYDIK